MPKKKHRKKVRSAKHAEHHKTAKHPARAKRSKSSKHRSAHAKPEHQSSGLLRAIKRRRAAERGEHPEANGMRRPDGHGHKHGRHPAHKRSHYQPEPVITEKSFENMLAYRRFQNHAR